MRVDKFLQVSRLVKRRASAKDVCDAGRVSINGRLAKPGSEVKVGDTVSLTWGHKTTEVEVLEMPERSMPAAQAKTIYQVLRETQHGADMSSPSQEC